MSTHTSLPWVLARTRRQARTGGGMNIYVRTADGTYLGQIHSEADAEFIVRACNSYDDLITALKQCAAYAGSAGHADAAEACHDIIATADAAIAKAKRTA